MSDVRVERIGSHDEPALRRWWEVGAATTAHDRPVSDWPGWRVVQSSYAAPRSDLARTLLLARAGDDVVGSGLLVTFLLDNPHLAELDVRVLPGHRRRGTGRLLLAELERLAAADRRTTLVGTAYAPLDAESPGSLFAAACGYPLANLEETKVLDLTTAPGSWPVLDAAVAAHLDGYAVRTFADRVPAEWVPDFCELQSAFVSMIPNGELDLEESAWTPERLREHEARQAACGRAWVGAVALAPDLTLVGFHESYVERDDPRLAAVGGTLVLPAHRGHRLGLAMKLAGHRRLLELHPGCRAVLTDNAGSNRPMNAVNEALGYRVVERALDVQKRVRT